MISTWPEGVEMVQVGSAQHGRGALRRVQEGVMAREVFQEVLRRRRCTIVHEIRRCSVHELSTSICSVTLAAMS